MNDNLRSPMTPSVCIIILNWNSNQDTLACLASLGEMSYKNFRVVVVDNGSSNNSVEMLSPISGIHLIENKTNLGFAGGNNVAIKYALGQNFDYVWLLNSDAIVEVDCLEKLVASAEKDSTIGLLSPVIYHRDRPDIIQHCGTRLNAGADGVHEADDIPIARQWQDQAPETVILWGTAMLIKSTLIRKIGDLDAHLFAYSEDTDYSLRSSRAGFRNVTVFDAKIWHASTEGLRKPHFYYYTTRNAALMWRKYTSTYKFMKICWWNFNRIKRLIEKFQDKPELVHASKLGLWDGWTGTGGEYDPSRKLPIGARAVFRLFG